MRDHIGEDRGAAIVEIRCVMLQGEIENSSPAHTEVQAGDDVPEWARRDSNARPLAPEAADARTALRWHCARRLPSRKVHLSATLPPSTSP